MHEALIQMAQPLFYFFLRKTGDADAAHDLTQDVLLSALASPRPIHHLHGWVWQVARRRYAAWVDGKRRASASLDEGTPDAADLEDDLVRRDDLALLRRELAFIRRDHRELIVAHYLQDEPLHAIALRLRLPLGTVKARLHRVRQKLREGMDMTRTFGKRSYDPETMDFVTSGNQPTGLPGRAMARKLPLNILLEASENPSTLEELSMALGVASPYMEEEVRLLTDATLLKQVGGKYVTDFYIMDGDTQKLLRKTLRQGAHRHTQAVKAIAADVLPMLSARFPHLPSGDLLWWLLPHVHEEALFSHPTYVCDLPERTCGTGETWGILGFEQVPDPDWAPCFLGRSADGVPGGLSCIYNYDHPCEAMWERTGQMDALQAALLLALTAGARPLSTMTAAEQTTWAAIKGRYAHAEGDQAIPDVLALTQKDLSSLTTAIRAHPAFEALTAAVQADFAHMISLLSERSSPILHAQLNYVASHEVLNLRMMVLHDCLKDGTLALPDHPETSAIGIWLEVR